MAVGRPGSRGGRAIGSTPGDENTAVRRVPCACVRVIETAELFRAIATLFAPAVVKNNESSGGCWLGSTSFDEFDDHAFLHESLRNIRLHAWRHGTERNGTIVPTPSFGRVSHVLPRRFARKGSPYPYQLGTRSLSSSRLVGSSARFRRRNANTLGAVFLERFRTSLEFGEGLYACFEGLWPVGS